MKKIYLALLLFFLLSNLSYSQQKKNEIYGSYGLASVQEISSILNDIIILPFVGGDFTIKSRVGPFIAGYKRNLSDHFTVGISGSYTSFDKEYTILNSNDLKFTVENTFITALADANFTYNPGNIVQLYSGLSAGVSSFQQKDSIETDNSTITAFQVNAIGIRAGKNIAAFLELGFGYKGIINGGLSIKF